jgi:hypothetical protein
MAVFQMFSKIISKLNSDGHVAIGLFIFMAGSAMHYYHGLDASFVAFTTTVFGFLGGHAYVQSKGASNDTPSTDAPSTAPADGK